MNKSELINKLAEELTAIEGGAWVNYSESTDGGIKFHAKNVITGASFGPVNMSDDSLNSLDEDEAADMLITQLESQIAQIRAGDLQIMTANSGEPIYISMDQMDDYFEMDTDGMSAHDLNKKLFEMRS